MIIQAKASKRPNLTVNFSQGGKVASFKDSLGKAGSWGQSCISAGRYGVEVPLVLLCASLRALKKRCEQQQKVCGGSEFKDREGQRTQRRLGLKFGQKNKNKC